MSILIVEDEKSIRDVLKSYFLKEGWQVYTSSNGLDALKIEQKFKLDIVLLDLMIPQLSGEEVCKKIRRNSTVPIVIISSKSREKDMINGLNIGADDYIVKPFRIKEVLARVNALLRRIDMFHQKKKKVLYFDNKGFIIDLEKQELMVDHTKISLTSTEFKILGALVQKPGKVFSRQDLSYIVQGYRFIGDGRTIDTHIKNLRKKIEKDPRNPKYIVTKIGSGYKFNSNMDQVT